MPFHTLNEKRKNQIKTLKSMTGKQSEPFFSVRGSLAGSALSIMNSAIRTMGANKKKKKVIAMKTNPIAQHNNRLKAALEE